MFTISKELFSELFSKDRLTSITIENFKGIGDAVTIPIRPITLLFGKTAQANQQYCMHCAIAKLY